MPSQCVGITDTCAEKVAEHCFESAPAKCSTAQKGDRCFKHLRWAMKIGIVRHPQWYPNLTVQSSFEDFQDLLHSRGLHHCQKPCPPLPVSCHTAAPGETCHRHVKWAMEKGIKIFPSWYPTLTKDSSFESFQEWLHHLHHGECAQPC